jgi:dipeptidyl aminopeptidase/acylaminoacyl peptidase
MKKSAFGIHWTICVGFIASCSAPVFGQVLYEKARPEIRAILDTPMPPRVDLSPKGTYALLLRYRTYPSISDLAEPMLPLAGIRINPRNNAHHDTSYAFELALKKMPDGAEVPVGLPPGARITGSFWNATETKIALLNTTATGCELWLLDPGTAKARRIDGVQLNPLLDTIAWMPDQRSLLVQLVVPDRGLPPATPAAPAGPYVDETTTGTIASSTYETRDLLKTPHDGNLFEYYTTSQIAFVDSASGKVTRIGQPACYETVSPSPDGRYLRVEQIKRPYSYLRTYQRFAKEVSLWDREGKVLEKLADLPLAEQVPIDGVRMGPRDHNWKPTAPATIIWVEALDDGDSYKKVPHHDRVMSKIPGGEPKEIFKTQQRLRGINWIEDGRALIAAVDLDAHRATVDLVDFDQPSAAVRRVWDRSTDDRYNAPGAPQHRVLPSGKLAVLLQDGAIFLAGPGASRGGNRPFLDRLDLATLKTERLFRSATNEVERFLEWLDPVKGIFVSLHESRVEPPNLYLRTLGGRLAHPPAEREAAWESSRRALTRYTDPAPQLRKVSKRLVTYERPDGVSLSFTLYLPPEYKAGTRLPTVLWAYPLDFTERSAAGQVRASPNRFVMPFGASPLFLALAGYAVLDEVAMPVVGPSETAYDTFVEQITANAKAAIDKAAEMGVSDPKRVGVFGHSHGALMTANLLIWTDFFRAGVARSGAYNHTLRPFGFQNERRTLYKARETYFKLSPLLQADRINEPLLLIHGELDANPGTVTLQSQKLYEAVRGVGGTARLVILPFESHGYRARESVEHVLHETIGWFDRFLREETTTSAAAGGR